MKKLTILFLVTLCFAGLSISASNTVKTYSIKTEKLNFEKTDWVVKDYPTDEKLVFHNNANAIVILESILIGSELKIEPKTSAAYNCYDYDRQEVLNINGFGSVIISCNTVVSLGGDDE